MISTCNAIDNKLNTRRSFVNLYISNENKLTFIWIISKDKQIKLFYLQVDDDKQKSGLHLI